MSYTWLTVATLKSYVRTELAVDDIHYQAAIDAGVPWLEQQTGRHIDLYAGGGATARVYDTPPDCELRIHDCTTVTAVSDFGVALTVDTQYKLYPLNGIDATGATVPYTSIVRLASGYVTSWLNYGKPGQITVTATWGWASIPPMIVEAAKIVAKEYFLQRDVAHGIVALTDVGGVGTRENALVRAAVNAYAHPNSIAIA